MTLLNAPAYDERKERRNHNLLVGSAVLLASMLVLSLAGFLLGHGWLFTNLPAEHRMKVFLTAMEAQDYPKAYGIYYNDPQWQQHSERYQDYSLDRFTEDFTTESDWKGPITSFHVDYSRRNKTGVVVAATINGSTNLTLMVNCKNDTLAAYPYVLTRGF